MRLLPYVVALAIVLAVLSVGMGAVSAQSQPAQGYGGGEVQGFVYGYTIYDELIPLDWVPVTATSNEYNFTTSTFGNGGYHMFLPVGDYNMSVYEPGFKPYSMSISVADGASLNGLNFYLERSEVPIPEFPGQTLTFIMIVAFASALLLKRAAKRRK
jgi:hypothetical protein